MKHSQVLLIVISILALYGCGDDCIDVGRSYRKGTSVAESNYLNLDAYATFRRSKGKNSQLSLVFVEETRNCKSNGQISFVKVPIVINDTMKVYNGYDQPTASYYFVDTDFSYEDYDLVDSLDNWMVITKINKDTTKLEGRFSLHFITRDERLLAGEYKRYDDPERPNAIHFHNGTFKAKYLK